MNRKMQVAALLGATMLSTSVWAQETDEIIVMSSPFQKATTDVISTTEILTAADIQNGIGGPIGDVLHGLPGVESAAFGPAVGQPIIRGLGGYRVDVLQNGMSVGDISSTGGDHANALSLFDTERVEVLKGPAALRYGAFAATGVVNSFNRHLDADTEQGSDVLLGYGGNAGETVAGAFTRQGRFSLSAFMQDADNITIPTHAETEEYHEDHGDEDHTLEEGEQEGENTESKSNGFALAGHFGDDATGLSVMLSSHDMEYHVPHAHEDDDHDEGEDSGDDDDEEHHDEGAVVDLEQQTVHARLTHNQAIGPFDGFRADASISSLEQSETADETTAFEQDSLHLRGEFTGVFNDWQTLVGLEYRDTELTAPEEEHHEEDEGEGEDEHAHGYLPDTESSQIGLFAFAERERNDWLTELAIRVDDVELEAKHEEEDDDDNHAHEEAPSFTLTNISAGLARKLAGDLMLGGSVSSTERAPSQVELFANGVHHAVGRTEIGNDELKKETSLSTELYIRKAWENSRLRVSIFNNDYSDFIYLDEREGADHTFDYKQADSELSGYELDYQTGFMLAGRMWDASLTYGSVTGELADGSNLPAIPADKIGIGIGTSFNTVDVKLDVEQVSDQTDLAADEHKTEGFTKVDISANWQPPQYEGLSLSASVRNLTDEEIRHHTSPLKDRMPEPGQDIRLTARYRF